MTRIPSLVRLSTLASSLTFLSLFLAPRSTLAAWQVCIFNLCFGSGGNAGAYGTFGDYGCQVTICRIGAQLLYIINYILVPLLFAAAFISFLYGVANAYIFSQGDSDKIEEGHKLILWGIIGFVVMISVWGLVNVVANTFGLAGNVAPILPVSYPPIGPGA